MFFSLEVGDEGEVLCRQDSDVVKGLQNKIHTVFPSPISSEVNSYRGRAKAFVSNMLKAAISCLLDRMNRRAFRLREECLVGARDTGCSKLTVPKMSWHILLTPLGSRQARGVLERRTLAHDGRKTTGEYTTL